MSFRNTFRRLVSPRNHTRPTRQNKTAMPRLEELESRTLMSVTAFLSGHQLVVQGDTSGNTIRMDIIERNYGTYERVSYLQPAVFSPILGGGYRPARWVDVGEFDANYGTFYSILIHSGGGGDTVNINDAETYDPITINGDAGRAVVNLNTLPYGAAVNVQNTYGYTELNVKDPWDASGVVTVDRTRLTLGHLGSESSYVVNYTPGDLSRLNVNLGSAGGSITVLDTYSNFFRDNTGTFINTPANSANWATTVRATSGPLTLNTNGPFDRVDIGSTTNTLGAIQGPVTVSGSGTILQLSVRDQGALAPQTYTLTGTSLTRSGAAAIQFASSSYTALTVNGGSGGNTYFLQGAPNAVGIYAGAGNNTINVGSAANTLAGLGRFTVVGQGGSDEINLNDQGATTPQTYTFGTFTFGGSYSSFTTTGTTVNYTAGVAGVALFGGSGGNTINFQAMQAGSAVNLDAGSGRNTLDYTGYAGNVLVNLPLGAATGFSRISNVQDVTGASGGPAGSYNVLIGNGGNVLTGENGRRNLLVAGASASTLIGGNDDDILIAGTTAYDTDPQWQAAFMAIMNEWTQATDYAVRVDHLMNGGGLNDPYLLNAMTVSSNGGGNTLTGHGGGATELDLYFANPDLGDTTDADPVLGEQLIAIA